MRKIALLLIVTSLAGCVATGKFEAEQKRADTLTQQVAAEKKAEDELKVQLKAAGDQLASSQRSAKELSDALDAKKGELSKKVSELIKERDALTQKLSETEAARKALEEAKVAELAAVKKSYEDLTSGLKHEIAAGEIKITQLKGKLTVNMVDRILFDSGQSEVKTDGRKVLEKVGELLNGVKDKDIRIEGHTDNKPIAGGLKEKYPTNWELSTARATAVARYLEDHARVDPKRLVATGYGEFRPVASNETPESRALNRRIEIVLVPKD